MATRNYASSYAAIHGSSGLDAQCEMFLVLAAIPAIQAEDPGTASHSARLAWANAVQFDAARLAVATQRVKVAAIQNATIRAAISSGSPAEDSDVEFVGTGLIPTLVALGA